MFVSTNKTNDMKYLNKVDLTKDGDEKYTTYFYHKYNKFVWEVVSNGEKCAISLAEELKINKEMKHGSKLPKYILNKLY